MTVAIAIAPCDAAVFNGKWNIIGALTTFSVKSFPGALPPSYAYVRAQGMPVGEAFEIAVPLASSRIADDGVDMEVLWSDRVEGQISSAPRGVSTQIVKFGLLVARVDAAGASPVVVPSSGEYELQAFFNDRLSGATILPVLRRKGER